MKAFSIHFLFALKTGIRDKTLLLMNYLFPLGFYFAISAIMPKMNPEYGAILIPSMMIFSILVSNILGLPEGLITSRNTGILRSYKINGIPKMSMLAIPTLTTALHNIVVTAIILITAPIVFGAQLPVNIGGLVIVFIATAIVFSGLALLISVLAENNSITVLYAQVIFLPSMLIGGLMVPASQMPESIGRVTRLLPTTYAMDAFNALAEKGDAAFNPAISLGILLSCGIISILVSSYLFKLDNNNTSKPKSKLWALLALVPLVLGVIFL
jgi:ABC-2 type transport system permease protein